jgi:hypothetical protein
MRFVIWVLTVVLLSTTAVEAGPLKKFRKKDNADEEKTRKVDLDDTFLGSDDYKEGEEVVGKFLTDDDYALMVEDVEFGDVDYDWLWAKATFKKKDKIESLDFDVASYGTVTIPEVKNFSSSLEPGFEDHIREVFTAGMERLGLEVVESGGALTLGIAMVDYKSDSTYIYFGNVDPFIELEIRLSAGDENLLLIRDQEHGNDTRAAATDSASELLKFLQ